MLPMRAAIRTSPSMIKRGKIDDTTVNLQVAAHKKDLDSFNQSEP
jgi:hypothetical protein